MGLRLCPYRAALLPSGLLLLLMLTDLALPAGRPPPVVLVPGDLGNQLEAKLDKPTVVHYLCSKRTDSYFTLWLNLELLLPVIIDCWIDNIRPEDGKGMWLRTQDSIGRHQLRCHLWVTGSTSPPGRLVYNRTSRTTQFPDGVDVRVPGFGKTFSLEFLDPSKSSVGSYFHTMVESLVGWGYTRGEDVRGAPYDWRRAPRDNNRIPVIGPLKIREQQRSAVSTSWLLPYNYTWSPKKVFVHTPTANYTLQDYRRFFQDIGFEDGWLMRQDTEGLVEAMVPPGVRLHCLYGTGVPTPDSFYYESFPDRDPKICFGDGDGTVNLQSALQCQAWRGHQEQEVSLQALPGTEHIAMLANATTLAYLKRVLLGP
ncbi:lysosomal phospholipase A and acyltransferase isoform X4 [Tursiops truncatus]|uniref:lysosomal phospholipase A and acyltransferase isoform X4 n=1 Tax=Tursiops truncatus TaxID=9739 RepID=UPI003CCF969A